MTKEVTRMMEDVDKAVIENDCTFDQAVKKTLTKWRREQARKVTRWQESK